MRAAMAELNTGLCQHFKWIVTVKQSVPLDTETLSYLLGISVYILGFNWVIFATSATIFDTKLSLRG